MCFWKWWICVVVVIVVVVVVVGIVIVCEEKVGCDGKEKVVDWVGVLKDAVEVVDVCVVVVGLGVVVVEEVVTDGVGVLVSEGVLLFGSLFSGGGIGGVGFDLLSVLFLNIINYSYKF